jgi:hypothetical protein
MGTSSNSVEDLEEMQQDVKKAVEEMVSVGCQYVYVLVDSFFYLDLQPLSFFFFFIPGRGCGQNFRRHS